MFLKKIVKAGTAFAVLSAVVLFGCGGGAGSFIDERDGREYRTIKMPDGKIWMAENLNHHTIKSRCYNNDESNCSTYGRLYDWNTAMTVCPSGWRLPSNEEWLALISAIGDTLTPGRKLKSKTGWSDNGNGSDNFGFSALPGGRFGNLFVVSGTISFGDVGYRGYWWSSTESNTTYMNRQMISENVTLPLAVTIGYYDDGVSIVYGNKVVEFSVRCVKDD